MSTNRRAGYADPVSLPMSGATPEMLADLVEALRGQVINGVRIHDARAATDITYEGEPVVRVRVLLDDPRPTEDIWPVKTTTAIGLLALREGWRVGIPDWVFASYTRLSNAEREGFPAAAPGERP